MAQQFFKAIFKFPSIKAEEEELVDPQVTLREKCSEAHCTKYLDKLQQCNDRVNSKQNTTESCYEELIDYAHCVDHCVAHDIHKYLK
ncbi:cytochrome b-c1 complex subunit 6, mitochondrial-like [Diaphorina citri]|uniref:Cytochrome b-c1 complex subunit 6 n=1 Tax=Diaphorina citri TaxID=121845 RepID=A0A1S4EIK9_DIACI|nr:cytochrome b-c1 complex subunit 6, mitochondrial-like [Diaphorina citri]KAI5705592.1 hypothetical protein M8J75_000056 [Diaphorina citri]KAI5741199.1 hypothetical protein M8J76_011385 [Diaphorina citri]KAI5741596.1 hypothetical protein M8J76_015222 [Diaphorina citri]